MFGGLMRWCGFASFRSLFMFCPRGCGEIALAPCANCGEQKWMMTGDGDAICCRWGCDFRVGSVICPSCGCEIPLKYAHRLGKDPRF